MLHNKKHDVFLPHSLSAKTSFNTLSNISHG